MNKERDSLTEPLPIACLQGTLAHKHPASVSLYPNEIRKWKLAKSDGFIQSDLTRGTKKSKPHMCDLAIYRRFEVKAGM